MLMEEVIMQIQFGVRGCFELIAPICRVVWKVLKCPLMEIGSPDGDLRIPLICWASRWQNSTQYTHGRGLRLFKWLNKFAKGNSSKTPNLDIHSILWFNLAGFMQGTYGVKWAQG